jgi:hygromycin-B 7''-O-kinase
MPLLPLLSAAEYRSARSRTDLWLPAIRAIAQRHGLSGDPVRFDDGSVPVFAVGTDRVVKLYPPHVARDFDVERAALARVEGRIGIATPALVAEGELEAWRYLVLSRVEGVAIDRAWSSIDAEDRRRLAAQAGAVVARMHALPLDDLAPLEIDWPAFFERQIEGCVERQRSVGVDERWLAAIPAYLDAARSAFRFPARRALLHTELGPGHLFVVERGGRWHLSGLIDFAEAFLGDPEYEFTAVGIFVTRGAPGLLRAFLLAYGYAECELTPELGTRLTAYALMHRYSKLDWYLSELATPPSVTTFEELAETWWCFEEA